MKKGREYSVAVDERMKREPRHKGSGDKDQRYASHRHFNTFFLLLFIHLARRFYSKWCINACTELKVKGLCQGLDSDPRVFRGRL